MIQMRRREQFTKAADRLSKEPQSIRRAEPHLYEVTNKTKGTSYHVRISNLDGNASCTCPAGLRHGRAPLACKHIAATIIFLRALKAMRDRASH